MYSKEELSEYTQKQPDCDDRDDDDHGDDHGDNDNDNDGDG